MILSTISLLLGKFLALEQLSQARQASQVQQSLGYAEILNFDLGLFYWRVVLFDIVPEIELLFISAEE